MPAKSKAQLRMMRAIADGRMKAPPGLSRAEAREFVEKTRNPKKLPERAKKGKR